MRSAEFGCRVLGAATAAATAAAAAAATAAAAAAAAATAAAAAAAAAAATATAAAAATAAVTAAASLGSWFLALRSINQSSFLYNPKNCLLPVYNLTALMRKIS